MRRLITIVLMLFMYSVNADTKVVVIPMDTSAAVAEDDGRLWGEGRPNVTANPLGAEIAVGRSHDLAPWGSAASACPSDSWVCSKSEIDQLRIYNESGSVTSIDCDGTINANNRNGWVSDSDTQDRSQGWAAYPFYYDIGIPQLTKWVIYTTMAKKCEYLPVYCCSNTN